MEKVAVRNKIQDFYRWGAALGIFWGLVVALLDVLLRSSPIGQYYLSIMTSITTPLYTQVAALTNKSPILLWLGNSLMSLMYVLIGYGVKITGTMLTGCWTFVLQNILQKMTQK